MNNGKCKWVTTLAVLLIAGGAAWADVATGWLHWRGPNQNGVSNETNLPSTWEVGGENHRWTIPDLKGRGTPVIARYADGDRLFVWGYRGSGMDIREVLVCVDPATGKILWEHAFNDFLSDHVYDRYSIGAPTVDAETGHVYLLTSPGRLMCHTRDGKLVWERSLLEEFGRLTFPNGRVGAPGIDGDLVIINIISSNWGVEGPARNRYYAFNKRTGDLVWSSDPGAGPPFMKDSSFASMVFEDRMGMRVFYSATGCGNIVAVNARTGEPLWRFQAAVGGVNSTPVVVGDRLVAVHGVENLDDTRAGRMIAIDVKKAFESWAAARQKPDFKGPLLLDASHELWRNNDLDMFTSSPVVVDNRIYQMTNQGSLYCVDLETGKTLWAKRLGTDQLHASPLYADGKLYIPMWHHGFYILKPTNTDAEVLAHVDVGAQCIGSPAVWNGQVFVHTLEALHCFGTPHNAMRTAAAAASITATKAGEPVKLMVEPAEVLLRPGDEVKLKVTAVDAAGLPVEVSGKPTWSKFVPPTAMVKAEMDAQVDENGVLRASDKAAISAGSFQVTLGNLSGTMRGRIVPAPPFSENFDGFELTESGSDGPFAHPPLPWIGARGKWQVRELDGQKVLAKTLDNVLFQRSMVFIGHPDERNYTIQADVMTGGNRRMRCDVGVINQRYIITLRGNNNILEVFSNHDRVKYSVPFRVQPNVWYTLKTRVDVAEDGSGVVRAKVWERGTDEPSEWTLEMEHRHAHQNGAPGLYGMTPQSLFPVYIDNVKVTPNK